MCKEERGSVWLGQCSFVSGLLAVAHCSSGLTHSLTLALPTAADSRASSWMQAIVWCYISQWVTRSTSGVKYHSMNHRLDLWYSIVGLRSWTDLVILCSSAWAIVVAVFSNTSIYGELTLVRRSVTNAINCIYWGVISRSFTDCTWAEESLSKCHSECYKNYVTLTETVEDKRWKRNRDKTRQTSTVVDLMDKKRHSFSTTMRKGGESRWSGPWHSGCTLEIFHVHSCQDQFIQPGWAECVFCIFSLDLCFACSFVLFDLFVSHFFVFPWAVESSPLQFLALA